jgi:hypothetical protein
MPTSRPGQPVRYEVHPPDQRPVRGPGEQNRSAAAGARIPGVSGRGSALVLAGLFVLTALALPLALHRALWVNAEAVLLAWFGIWTAALAWLGYSGRGVERDWGDYRPLWHFGGSSGGHGWASALSSADLSGLDAGEGCLGMLVAIVVVVVAAIVLGWLVPLIAVGLYATVRALLNSVGRHAEATRGHLLPALAYGAAWAAIYTAPLALAVLALHLAQ